VLKRWYVGALLWCLGRAVQSSVRVHERIGREFDALPAGYTFRLGVMPDGPWMVVGKDAQGHPRHRRSSTPDEAIDLDMRIRSLDAAMRMFTFRESTATAVCRNRLIVDGDVPPACAVVRILDAVEVYLLPKPLARRAVKRYPSWPLWEKTRGRLRMAVGMVSGR
jgi:hypothetical protein